MMSPVTAGRLVGRTDELRTVTDALGRGASVAVTGPAGIGKSAVAAVTLRRRRHCEAGALPSFRHLPYFALSRAFGTRFDGSPDAVSGRVLALLAGAVLLVEDLHWADDATFEVVASLVTLAPLLLTARLDELSASATALVDSITNVSLAPLDARSADALTARIAPGLDAAARASVVRQAGGNPLLLEAFADTRGDSPSLLAAVADRLRDEPADVRRVLGRLALLGRSEPGITTPDSMALFVDERDDGVTIRHPLLADAIADALRDDERAALHAELADSLNGAESVAHAVLAGDADAAVRRADAVLAEQLAPAERAEVKRLRATASVDGDHALEAATALVDAGRWIEAIDAAERALVLGCADRTEALLCLGRALWFIADIDGAEVAFRRALDELETQEHPGALRVLLEHAYLRVRDRKPGSTELAHDAFALAERLGAERARASSVLGAALLYDGTNGWQEMLEQAIELAGSAGDEDLASTAAYHLVSGLGFVGHLRASIEVARTWSVRARAAGLDTWAVHFEAVDLYDSVLMAVDPPATAERAREFLDRNPVFRNRFMIELARTLSLADAGDAEGAARAADAAAARATIVEAKVFALLSRNELAWVAGDVDRAVATTLALREHGNAWFGIRTVAEAGAAHLCAEHGRVFDPEPTTTLIPILWPALDELEGWRRHREGDDEGAVARLRSAAAAWVRHDMPRFAVRAQHGAWLTGRHPSDLEEAVAIAREHGLVAHLRRLGHVGVATLTAREVEVLRLVAKGMTSARVADALGISRATVDDHVKRARAKLGATSRLEAARLVAGS